MQYDGNNQTILMIVGGIATIPSREVTLKRVLDSIVPQVDMVVLVLNGYDRIPEWIHKTYNINGLLKISIMLNPLNEKGDAMKFTLADIPDLVYLSYDDDLLYPKGYVDYMIDGIKRHNGIVSLHGRVYDIPVKHYRLFKANYRCLNHVENDVQVNFLGTGCMAFDTNRLKVSLSDFKEKNMADCYIAKLCHEQSVPMWVLKHPSDYLTYLPQKETIWKNVEMGDIKQTQLLKSFLI